MTFDIDLSSIPNKETWIAAAKEAANQPDDLKLWEKLIAVTEYLPSLNLKTKYKVNSNSCEEEKQLVLLSYENLLVNFPLLEQFWINYARWFYRFNKLDRCIEVYERALAILPGSLLIWNSYMDLLLQINSDNEEMISNFERARIAIGFNYYASLFFDKYLLFLKNNHLMKPYHLLLRRIIELPQHDYSKYFSMFFSLLEKADLDTIKYFISRGDLQNDYNFTWVDLLQVKNLDKLKTELRKKFLDLYITTQYYSWKFFNYERNISTHYSIPNVPLSRQELQTWRSYLEFVEVLNMKGATKEKELSLIKNNTYLIDTIYNRCLIATSPYHFFWIKLSNYYLNYGNTESAKKILLRGIYLTPVENLTLRLRLIDLYIIGLEFDKAKAIIYETQQVLPHNLEIFCKLLQVEHFVLPSNVEKLIINKLTDISKLKNSELESQFDYLFIEMLNYSCISISKLSDIFEKYSGKKSHHYLKAKENFYKYYSLDAESLPTPKKIPDGWSCEYF